MSLSRPRKLKFLAGAWLAGPPANLHIERTGCPCLPEFGKNCCASLLPAPWLSCAADETSPRLLLQRCFGTQVVDSVVGWVSPDLVWPLVEHRCEARSLN